MENHIGLHPSDHQAIYKANSGSIRFKMRTAGHSPEFGLIEHREPHDCLYKSKFSKTASKSNSTKSDFFVELDLDAVIIGSSLNFYVTNCLKSDLFETVCEQNDKLDWTICMTRPIKCIRQLTFGYETILHNLNDNQEVKFPSSAVSDFNDFREFYLTWHNNKIKLGVIGQEPFVDYQKKVTDPIIGYILFKTRSRRAHVEWIVETSPVLLKSIPFKKLNERPHWRTMTNGKLPPNAMVGGFDNELIYIARAEHRSSLCPGKYVPSTGKAFVPWGHIENAKEDFEILCGINAQWVKTRSNYIPQNAFIGGYSEVRNEPLYIGRAMIEGRLICGKVHLLYKTCYLPYQGREVEKSMYEILVIPDDEIPQALPLQAF